MEQTKCNVCKIKKNNKNFYKRENGKIRKECKLCRRKKGIKYYFKNKEEILNKRHIYHQKNKDKIRKTKEIYRRKNPNKVNKWERNFRNKYWNISKYKRRRLANYCVRNAIRRGDIIKPDKCQICGIKTKIETHHYKGYKKKNWLDIIFICKLCHNKLTFKNYV